MKIAVCAPQVPFTRGGAEIFADDLVAELRARDHEVDLVTVPYKWYPGERVLSQAFLWRLLDLEEADGRTIDLLIATKFPSYAVRHRNKVVWLLHQFRQAYELDRTDLGQFDESAEDRATRRAVQRLDRVALGEARKLFATSRNVAERLERSTGLSAEVMPHPPQELPYRTESYDDFVLSVGPLDRRKRHDLLLDALATDVSLRCVIVGDGPDREDFGMVPYEAFLSEKPVVTTTDAGGPLEVVADGRTGLVCEPRAAAVAEACSWLRAHVDDAKEWGRAGKEIARRVSWNETIQRLLS